MDSAEEQRLRQALRALEFEQEELEERRQQAVRRGAAGVPDRIVVEQQQAMLQARLTALKGRLMAQGNPHP